MIDKNIIWNLGGWGTASIKTSDMYEKERGTNAYIDSNVSRPIEWSKINDIGDKYNGIGLIYPSDFGYAIGGDVRNTCLDNNLVDFSKDNCTQNVWLNANNDWLWFLSQDSFYSNYAFTINPSGVVYANGGVRFPRYILPTLYLKSAIKILPNSKPELEYGSIENPFILQ